MLRALNLLNRFERYLASTSSRIASSDEPSDSSYDSSEVDRFYRPRRRTGLTTPITSETDPDLEDSELDWTWDPETGLHPPRSLGRGANGRLGIGSVSPPATLVPPSATATSSTAAPQAKVKTPLKRARSHPQDTGEPRGKQSPYFLKAKRGAAEDDSDHNADNDKGMVQTRSRTRAVAGERQSSGEADQRADPVTPTPKRKRGTRSSVEAATKRETADNERFGTEVDITSGGKPKRTRRKKDVLVEIPTAINGQVSADTAPAKQVKRKRQPKQQAEGQTTTPAKVKIARNPPASMPFDIEQDVWAKNEKGVMEPVGKIHLIQERLRFNPWKMLVATTLLNVTSGRAARPVLEVLLERWPTPAHMAEASITDLSTLLYPLGLYNQRASSLVRFSRQYLDLGWPSYAQADSGDHILDTLELPPLPIPSPNGDSDTTLDIDAQGRATPETPHAPWQHPKDVRVFHGSGIYASDSFRIFSHLPAGRGAPEKEDRWLHKRQRALERMRAEKRGDKEVDVVDGNVTRVREWMSDDEADGVDEGEEEWRRVRPNDKELRRYLIWRWGIEGIAYDIYSGPKIVHPRDRQRLEYLLETGEQ
ncbi:hypothetical protein IAU60_004079 [Kwoniella sp. DSM 27419]